MAVTDQILVGGNSMFGIGLQAGKGAPRSTKLTVPLVQSTRVCRMA